MGEAIGIRMDSDFLKKIDLLSKEEAEDRSTILRKLSLIGYKEFVKEKAAEKYMQGDITMSEAAHRADLSIFDMEKFLVRKGFVSHFSIEDLKREIKLLKSF